MPDTSYSELMGKRTLIMGDVGTGKTSLTRRLLMEAMKRAPANITVIDMAPEKRMIDGVEIGGALLNSKEKKVRILSAPDIRAPRLTAKSPEELLSLAEFNRRATEKLLRTFLKKPSKVLFINDVSIYLQRGDVEALLQAIGKAETVVANGYYGEKLRADLGTGISAREITMMDKLAENMDVTILTHHPPSPSILESIDKRAEV